MIWKELPDGKSVIFTGREAVENTARNSAVWWKSLEFCRIWDLPLVATGTDDSSAVRVPEIFAGRDVEESDSGCKPVEGWPLKAPSLGGFSRRHESCCVERERDCPSFHSQEESQMKAAGTALMVSVLTLMAAGTAFAAGQPPITVPMPASLGLLVTGLVGLAGAGWWMRRK